jgi:hypothetical protein
MTKKRGTFVDKSFDNIVSRAVSEIDVRAGRLGIRMSNKISVLSTFNTALFWSGR